MMRGSRALVMRPKLLELTDGLGLFNGVWFSTLKNSARYCNRQRSVRGKLNFFLPNH